MTDKIHQLPTKPDAILAAGEELRRKLPALIENATMIAKLKRAHYNAYLKEGFTPEQAIELIKKL